LANDFKDFDTSLGSDLTLSFAIRSPRQPRLIRPLGIALDFLEGLVPGDSGDLVRGASGIGESGS